MAKGSKLGEQNGKVKFRIIEFEMEGSDETLQDSLKNLAAAFVKAGPVVQNRVIRQDPQRQLEASTSDDSSNMESDLIEIPDDESATSPQVRRNQSVKKSRTPAAKVLNDIRLDDVSPTLKEFCSEKNPKSDLDKYLVIAYWFKHSKQIQDLSASHFFTAYRLMGWSVPRDPGQPIRDLRHRRKGHFSPGQAVGVSTINHIGENIVLEMRTGQ